MYNNRSQLLEQVPLTVSPFVSIPTATTLSYNYKSMPSALPPSALGVPPASSAAAPSSSEDGGPNDQNQQPPKPRYVVSSSGHAAHPDDIIASCRALQSHIARMQEDAERELREFDERIRTRELAEKRRVAPGWLDSEARILEPERKGAAAGSSGGGEGSSVEGGVTKEADGYDAGTLHEGGSRGMDAQGGGGGGGSGDGAAAGTDEGAELDRMFGGMSMK